MPVKRNSKKLKLEDEILSGLDDQPNPGSVNIDNPSPDSSNDFRFNEVPRKRLAFHIVIGYTQIMVVLLIIASFMLGSLYTRVEIMKNQPSTSPTENAPSGNTGSSNGAPTKVNVGLGHLPILGNKNAKVSIVEFADLRCPFCDEFYKNTESEIIKNYVNTGKAKFAFRHYAFLGPASTEAANAVECANAQGKFWQMHNYLYENQPLESDTSMYTVNKLASIAGSLGMNITQFKSCLSSNKYNSNVEADFKAGQNAGVSGTPTIFINGTPIIGAQPYSVFKQAIDAQLNKS